MDKKKTYYRNVCENRKPIEVKVICILCQFMSRRILFNRKIGHKSYGFYRNTGIVIHLWSEKHIFIKI